MNEIILDSFNEDIIGISSKIENKTIGFFSYYNIPKKELNIELFESIQSKFENYLIIGKFFFLLEQKL